MKTTNPTKVKAKIESTIPFAIALNNLDRAVRDINKLPLSNKQKRLIQDTYKGY